MVSGPSNNIGLFASVTTTATATKPSFKKYIHAASNFIKFIPTRSIRQIIAIFSGVEF